MDKKVLTVGEVNVDIILSNLLHLPRAEQDVIAQNFDLVIGGQTGSIARALSSLGVNVRFVGRVGNDDYGRMAVEQLRVDGVDASGVLTDSTVSTGVTVVLSTGRERAYATYLGSMSVIQPADVRQALLKPVDHLHIGSYYLQSKLRPFLPELFDEAHKLGVTTSVDPGWDPFNRWEPDMFDVLAHTDLFLPNEIEAMTITGTTSFEEALDALSSYANTVVIKMGENGCTVRNKTGKTACPAFKVDVVDVTSAGDMFNAGYLYGFLSGWEMDRSARFANACGAIATTRVGSQGMMSGLAEVEAFLSAHA